MSAQSRRRRGDRSDAPPAPCHGPASPPPRDRPRVTATSSRPRVTGTSPPPRVTSTVSRPRVTSTSPPPPRHQHRITQNAGKSPPRAPTPPNKPLTVVNLLRFRMRRRERFRRRKHDWMRQREMTAPLRHPPPSHPRTLSAGSDPHRVGRSCGLTSRQAATTPEWMLRRSPSASAGSGDKATAAVTENAGKPPPHASATPRKPLTVVNLLRFRQPGWRHVRQ
jgi:hypothetical protein